MTYSDVRSMHAAGSLAGSGHSSASTSVMQREFSLAMRGHPRVSSGDRKQLRGVFFRAFRERAGTRNPSRIGKRVMVARRKKAAADRRVASALATYLKRLNPGRKLAGAKVQKLVIKITPVKLNRGRR